MEWSIQRQKMAIAIPLFGGPIKGLLINKNSQKMALEYQLYRGFQIWSNE